MFPQEYIKISYLDKEVLRRLDSMLAGTQYDYAAQLYSDKWLRERVLFTANIAGGSLQLNELVPPDFIGEPAAGGKFYFKDDVHLFVAGQGQAGVYLPKNCLLTGHERKVKLGADGEIVFDAGGVPLYESGALVQAVMQCGGGFIAENLVLVDGVFHFVMRGGKAHIVNVILPKVLLTSLDGSVKLVHGAGSFAQFDLSVVASLKSANNALTVTKNKLNDYTLTAKPVVLTAQDSITTITNSATNEIGISVQEVAISSSDGSISASKTGANAYNLQAVAQPHSHPVVLLVSGDGSISISKRLLSNNTEYSLKVNRSVFDIVSSDANLLSVVESATSPGKFTLYPKGASILSSDSALLEVSKGTGDNFTLKPKEVVFNSTGSLVSVVKNSKNNFTLQSAVFFAFGAIEVAEEYGGWIDLYVPVISIKSKRPALISVRKVVNTREKHEWELEFTGELVSTNDLLSITKSYAGATEDVSRHNGWKFTVKEIVLGSSDGSIEVEKVAGKLNEFDLKANASGGEITSPDGSIAVDKDEEGAWTLSCKAELDKLRAEFTAMKTAFGQMINKQNTTINQLNEKLAFVVANCCGEQGSMDTFPEPEANGKIDCNKLLQWFQNSWADDLRGLMQPCDLEGAPYYLIFSIPSVFEYLAGYISRNTPPTPAVPGGGSNNYTYLYTNMQMIYSTVSARIRSDCDKGQEWTMMDIRQAVDELWEAKFGFTYSEFLRGFDPRKFMPSWPDCTPTAQ